MPKQYQGGLFSPPKFNAAGLPYNDRIDSPANAHGMTRGARQFGVGLGIKSKFNRLYEGEEYKSMSKIMSESRMAGKAKFLTPTGFRPSSPLKQDSCPGDWSGTFRRKPPPYVPLGEVTGPRQKFESFKARPIFTQPPKKAVGAPFTTPNIHFTKLEYASSPFDAADQAERARTAEGKRKMDGKPPFKGISLGHDPLSSPGKDSSEPQSTTKGGGLGATGSSHGGDGGKGGTGRGLSSSHGSRKKVGTDGGGEEDPKPFIPSHTLKSGAEYSVFSHYPGHEPDPYDDKIIRNAGSTGRLLPMAEQLKTLPEPLRERRPWSPTNPAKSMYTRTIAADF